LLKAIEADGLRPGAALKIGLLTGVFEEIPPDERRMELAQTE